MDRYLLRSHWFRPLVHRNKLNHSHKYWDPFSFYSHYWGIAFVVPSVNQINLEPSAMSKLLILADSREMLVSSFCKHLCQLRLLWRKQLPVKVLMATPWRCRNSDDWSQLLKEQKEGSAVSTDCVWCAANTPTVARQKMMQERSVQTECAALRAAIVFSGEPGPLHWTHTSDVKKMPLKSSPGVRGKTCSDFSGLPNAWWWCY